MNPVDTAAIDAPDALYTEREYRCVARAIAYLREHAGAQPSLTAVAHHVHLSEHHFQRLFTRWAGISPKRFVQHLTAEHAKACSSAEGSVLELASAVGLSGPGRLHDLFVTLEAMSPGEFRAGGAGLGIRYGVHDSPFGRCLIATTARGICNLEFLDGTCTTAAATLLSAHWPNARLAFDPAATASIAKRIFAPLTTARRKPLALLVRGTNFQLKVWRALLALPFGRCTSYHRIAEAVGKPSAGRAVGNAVGANPVAYLIPCHRVLRASGALGGYRWGTERKAAMLAWEAARAAYRSPLAADSSTSR